MKQPTETQAQQILNYLLLGMTINGMEALRLFGCFRLPARVADLKAEGFNIDKKMVKTDSGKHIAEYFIPQNNVSV